MGARIVPGRSYTEIFDEAFPYFLSIGMSYAEFWYKDPHLVRAFAKAEEIRRNRINQELYLQGFYIYEAIGAFREILPAFPKKGAKIHPYLDEPLPLTQMEIEAREAEKQKAKLEKMKQRMFARALSINSKMGGADIERNSD